MRHLAFDVIRDEHRALAAMLRSMGLLVDQARRAGHPPDFAVLRAMLFDVAEFPERLHHPKASEWPSPQVRSRCPERSATLVRLVAALAANRDPLTGRHEASRCSARS